MFVHLTGSYMRRN